jgi:DNA-directed RNA polymerase specialized sigma24 family protein
VPLEWDVKSTEKDFDEIIDLESALDRLEESEKDLICEHFYNGISYTELAKKDHTTRQAKSQQGRRILAKIKGIF